MGRTASGQAPSSIDMCLAALDFHPAYTGPGMRFRRYAPGLVARGVTMRVFAGTPDLRKLASSAVEEWTEKLARHAAGDLLPVQTVDSIPVQQVKLHAQHKRKRVTAFAQSLLRYCQESRNRPDLIQLLTLSLWSVPWIVRLRQHGVPMVFTHTLLGRLSDSAVKRSLQRMARRMTLQSVDCMVVSSRTMRKQIVDSGISGRIEVIPNGVNLHQFQPARNLAERLNIRQRSGIPPEARVILTVGPIIPRKAPEILIQAWGQLCHRYPEAWLVLVGPRTDRSYPSYRQFGEQIEALVTATSAPERILFTGAVDNVEDYLRAADLFVFPSQREGMPNVVPEAMASGLATVLTPFLGLPSEFGEAGRDYVLAERTPEALAQVMRELLDDPEQCQQLGRRGRKWVEAELDVERSLDQYAALYRELADQSMAGRLRA